MTVLFWFCAGVIIYVYFGYPFLIYILSRLRPDPKPGKETWLPSVSLIIPAYNEERVIADKIRNSLLLDYPREKLEIIIASDGSTDETDNLVGSFSKDNVKLIRLENRGGKSLAENAAVKQSGGEIICFSDASIRLDPTALRQLVNAMSNSKVGCAFGKVSFVNEGSTDITRGEGIYYSYELWIRDSESRLGNLAMSTGSVMCLKRSLFTTLDADTGEDFVIPIKLALQGYRTVFVKEAKAYEVLGQSWPESMFRSKVRVIAKDLLGVFRNSQILNPFKYPLYSWSLVSHKLARWFIPYIMLLMLVVNGILFGVNSGWFYTFTFFAQLLFYFSALISYLLRGRVRFPFSLSAPFFFCLINSASLIAIAKFAAGGKFGIWQPYRERFR